MNSTHSDLFYRIYELCSEILACMGAYEVQRYPSHIEDEAYAIREQSLALLAKANHSESLLENGVISREDADQNSTEIYAQLNVNIEKLDRLLTLIEDENSDD